MYFAIFQESTALSCTEQQIVLWNPEKSNKNDQKTRKHDLPGETEQVLVSSTAEMTGRQHDRSLQTYIGKIKRGRESTILYIH